MRQAVIASLAVPMSVAAHAAAVVRRSVVARIGLGVSVALLVSLGLVAASLPAPTVALLPTPILPLNPAAFTTTFSTGRGLTEPMTIRFSAPMDPDSVLASVNVDPPTPVDLAWDATGTALTVTPRPHWAAATLETITVRAGALARSGQPLAVPARAAFLTRDPASGSVAVTDQFGTRASIETSFLVWFAGPVDPKTVDSAISLDPPTPGTVRSSNHGDGPTEYLFVPTAPLQPDVDYRLMVSGVRDVDGQPIDPVSLSVRTTPAPAVVRFDPTTSARDVARDAAISVHFSEAMDRSSTADAFRAAVGGKKIAGAVSWADADRALVFTPSSRLPFGATVSVDVAASALSTARVPLVAAGHVTFGTVTPPPPPAPPKPAAPAPAKTRAASAPTGGGGAAVGGGSWAAVETYYLGLMNCTRTGGWVTSTGACSSPGGRNVAPLKLDSDISSNVSRPYARKLAVGNDCSHFIGGTPGTRLKAAGYMRNFWAENIGCRSGGARAAVLATHLFFQSERPYLGGHYVNLMNAAYDRVGIGVWVASGRVRLVIDFYHP